MILDKLIHYSWDVLEDKVVACKKHKQACQRFLKDLENAGKPSFPYVFNEEKAEKFLKWMTFFKHTKGAEGIVGKHKIPEPIEEFIFGNVYGWVSVDTQTRRFRKSYWQVARKNAKSQDQAIVALYELACMGEACAEVYVAATKKDQTRYVWGEADLLIKGCNALTGKILTKFHQPLSSTVILHPKSGSFFARMSKDDKKKGDGSNPQCAILDEYHAHPTSEYYDVLTSGMKSRKQPLLMIITTAGFELNYPCYKEEYRYISSILDPDNVIENDRYFVMVNELDKDDEGNLIDDITDESIWAKANPIVVRTQVGMDSIRDELKVSQGKPEKERDFLTKTMNVWCEDKVKGYMNLSKWKMCGATEDNPFPNLVNREVRIGVDLTSKLDIASVSFEFTLDDDRIAVLSHSFMPEAAFAKRVADGRQPWALWKKLGYITVTEGEVFDDRYMEEYIFRQLEEHNWQWSSLGYDLYNATQFANRLRTDRGKNLESDVIEIRQGIPSLHEPTKDFREMVYAGKIIHDNDPLLNFAMGNAITDTNAQGNMMLNKGASYDNIDPAAALINAHYLYLKFKPDDSCPYNSERGILIM